MEGAVKPILTVEGAIDAARASGYQSLSPLARQVAIEFVTTGCTVKEMARRFGQDLYDVRREFNNPITRAFISDLQKEIAQHKVINAAWVEQQILDLWPKFIGEEDVELVSAKGESFSAPKFHAAEVTSILKHFSGNADQKAAGGVQVIIDFGSMGVGSAPAIDVSGAVDA